MRSLLLLLLLPWSALAADFDIALSYGQSRDFWKTVQDIQNRSGNLPSIQSTIRDKYGKPDLLYSSLDAAYSYSSDRDSFLNHNVVGSRAEAVAGGEISNPIFPEIQAYANTTGILSYGWKTGPERFPWNVEWKALAGIGPEKRLFAQGAEFIDAIPVRTGTLFLMGTEARAVHTWSTGDFGINTDALLRPLYFHSTTEAARSKQEEDNSFFTVRWKLQNEWTKGIEVPFAHNARFGIISAIGQNPLPFLDLPVTWDYQQKLDIYPGLGSVSGIGGIMRLTYDTNFPNLTFHAGYYGGAIGGGFNVQWGQILFHASSYGVENLLTPAREKTRLWSATLVLAL